MRPSDSFSEIEIFREFVALVDDLAASSLNQRLFDTGKITASTQGNDWSKGQILNFDEDACRSFLLMFRLLVQDNDNISLRRISRMVTNGPYPDHLGEKIEFLRMLFDTTMSNGAPYAPEMTLAGMRDVFLWGAYAHRCHSVGPRRLFLKWQSETDTFVLRKHAFLMSLWVTFDLAQDVSEIVCELLADWDEKNGEPLEPAET